MDELTREILENSFENSSRLNIANTGRVISKNSSQEPEVDSSLYVLAREDSTLSRDIDCWLRGPSTETTRSSRTPVARGSSLGSNTIGALWYTLALFLPLFRANSYVGWRCSPSAILNSAEAFLGQVCTVCDRIRQHIRHVTQHRVSREIFATMMDLILVVYAVGFLILSMYQASVIR